MDLNRIAIFLRVVELGSFTRAARALSLPTSSVSRSVSQLEEELGVRLLQRTTRTLRLTEAGEAYASRAQAGLQVLGEAEHEVRAFGNQLGGKVRITASSDMSSYLAEFAAEITAKLPKVSLEFVLTPRRLDLLSEGIDLGIRSDQDVGENLVARRIGVAHMSMYAARSMLERRLAPASLEQLAEFPFVVFRGQNTLTLQHASGVSIVEVGGSLGSDDMTFVWHAVRRGLGIGMLPAYIGDQGVADGLLERVLPGYWFESTPHFVVMLGGRHLRPNVLAVRDELVQSLKARDWWGPRSAEPGAHEAIDLAAQAPQTLVRASRPITSSPVF